MMPQGDRSGQHRAVATTAGAAPSGAQVLLSPQQGCMQGQQQLQGLLLQQQQQPQMQQWQAQQPQMQQPSAIPWQQQQQLGISWQQHQQPVMMPFQQQQQQPVMMPWQQPQQQQHSASLQPPASGLRHLSIVGGGNSSRRSGGGSSQRRNSSSKSRAQDELKARIQAAVDAIPSTPPPSPTAVQSYDEINNSTNKPPARDVCGCKVERGLTASRMFEVGWDGSLEMEGGWGRAAGAGRRVGHCAETGCVRLTHACAFVFVLWHNILTTGA